MDEHPFMKFAAAVAGKVLLLLGIAAIALIAAALTPPPANAAEKQKKELKKTQPSPEPFSFDPVSYRAECLKRRSVKTCERLIELQQNFEDIKKQSVPLQLQ